MAEHYSVSLHHRRTPRVRRPKFRAKQLGLSAKKLTCTVAALSLLALIFWLIQFRTTPPSYQTPPADQVELARDDLAERVRAALSSHASQELAAEITQARAIKRSAEAEIEFLESATMAWYPGLSSEEMAAEPTRSAIVEREIANLDAELDAKSQALNDLRENAVTTSSDDPPRSQTVREYCESIGSGLSDYDCTEVQGLFDALTTATFHFSTVEQMMLGEIARFGVSVNPRHPTLAKEAVCSNGEECQSEEAKWSRTMKAELFGESFQISPAGLVERTILENNTSEWNWDIKAIQEGEKELLRLTLFAEIIPASSEASTVQIVSFQKEIEVKVGVYQQLLGFANDWGVIFGTLLALLTLIGAISKYLSRTKGVTPQEDGS